jgi:hypothetical protein
MAAPFATPLMTLGIVDLGAARRDRRYKHDMTKEERRPLQLTRVGPLFSFAEQQRRSVQIAVDAKVEGGANLHAHALGWRLGVERGPRRRLAGVIFPR